MSPVARSRQAHAFSTGKKKKIYRDSENPTITSLAEKSNRWQRKHTPMPDTAYRANQTQQQTKLNTQSTANQTQSTQRETQRTQRNRGFYLEKKKRNRQYTNKNQTPANPPSRRRDAAARSSSPSTLAPHRRSEIDLCSSARSEICRQ